MWIDEERMIDIVSDHNMLVVECKDTTRKVSEDRRKKKKWKLRDADWENFQVDLSETSWMNTGMKGVDALNEELVENVKSAAIRQIGLVKMGGRKRKSNPWWNEDIRESRKERKELNRRCRWLRKKRNESDEAEEEYQNAWEAYVKQQRRVKRKIREAKAKCEKDAIQSLRERGVEGGQEWYRFLRGEQFSDGGGVESLKVNGELVTDKKKMKECIKDFWEEIGGVDEVQISKVDAVTLERKDSEELNEKISKKEVEECVRKQKNAKAAGPDEVPYEFLKFGGDMVIEKMTELYNCVWEEERVPRKWNECKVTLLHKGGYKSKNELKNYRPIALGNTVGKVFSAVLNKRVCEWIERTRVLGEEQNGFRKDRRAEDNVFVISELIEGKKGSREKLYLGFLDIEKAYDRVNREMLCGVLGKVGLSEKIVNIVKSMYVDTKARYRLGSLETDWVKSERGVRQGCILSPTLFSLYTEELSVRVRRMNAGVKIGEDKIGILLYADDVVVLSESAEEFQKILDVVGEYEKDFGVKFSGEKSKVMIVNRSEKDSDIAWRLGGRELQEVEEYKYLGIWVSTKGCERSKNEKISLTNQWVGRLGSVARMRACKYEVLRDVWKSVAVPGIMYGMDVIAWKEKEIAKLEVGQNKIARMALNAPKYAAIEALRGDMGWSTFRERISKATLRYKARLERMEDTRLARKVYMWNIRSSRWGRRCTDLTNEIGLTVVWSSWITERGQKVYEWKMTCGKGEGPEWNVSKWKRVIEKEVKRVGLNEWKNGMEKKKTLEWYKEKKEPRYERWYDGSLGGDLLFRARAQCMGVNARSYRWSESQSKTCQMCEMGENETVEHVFLECEGYANERWEMMQTTLRELGCKENERTEKTGKEWMMVLVGLCEESTEGIIEAAKEFLEKMWSTRQET